jgi:hypothetical protein
LQTRRRRHYHVFCIFYSLISLFWFLSSLFRFFERTRSQMIKNQMIFYEYETKLVFKRIIFEMNFNNTLLTCISDKNVWLWLNTSWVYGKTPVNYIMPENTRTIFSTSNLNSIYSTRNLLRKYIAVTFASHIKLLHKTLITFVLFLSRIIISSAS